MTAAQPDFLDRATLSELQRQKLATLVAEIVPRNRFYTRKFHEARADLSNGRIVELQRIPFTTKAELIRDQADNPPYGSILTYARDGYSRLHQTSGTTTGKPLRWLDTPESWSWMLDCWRMKLRFMGIRQDDRLFFPFSFGPFLGFWTAFDAVARLGYFCLSGGGMTTSARLRFMMENHSTVVLCTPTYALRMAEVARAEGIDLAKSTIRIVVVAGEPGGSIAETRSSIEAAWDARVFDHYGMTEIGPLGIECAENPAGLHMLESECIVEVIDPQSTAPVAPGQTGELVLTNLGRLGSPLLRYRTGDLVRIDPQPCSCGRSLMRLQGGILGRTDDMIYLRGNNLYPAALEAVIRRVREVAEYRVEIDWSSPLPGLKIEVEPADEGASIALAERVERAIQDELLFRPEVVVVRPGSLPRFEMKAKRISHVARGK